MRSPYKLDFIIINIIPFLIPWGKNHTALKFSNLIEFHIELSIASMQLKQRLQNLEIDFFLNNTFFKKFIIKMYMNINSADRTQRSFLKNF